MSGAAVVGGLAPVAALYTTAASVYRGLVRECFDIHRDARTYRGWLPVVAHPPCRGWGRLRHFAKIRSDELDLAVHAVHQVRRRGEWIHRSRSLGSLYRLRCGVLADGG